MNNGELFVVQYEGRDDETGDYLVKKVANGETITVPSISSIFILSIEQGQSLILFQPQGDTHGYLLAPI